MKTTIYELLGMIKDNKAPKKIIYKDEPFEYDTQEKDYYFDNGLNRIIWLFDEYVITDILNDEVEILETTYKPDKINKIDYNFGLKWIECNINKEVRDEIDDEINFLHSKINEIIDRLNKE